MKNHVRIITRKEFLKAWPDDVKKRTQLVEPSFYTRSDGYIRVLLPIHAMAIGSNLIYTDEQMV